MTISPNSDNVVNENPFAVKKGLKKPEGTPKPKVVVEPAKRDEEVLDPFVAKERRKAAGESMPLTVVEPAIPVAGYEITDVGLIITRPLTYQEWLDCGQVIAGRYNGARWAIGDWMIYGEGRGDFGETYAQAIDQTKLSYSSVTKCAYVSQNFSFSVRRKKSQLSWSHHLEVCPLNEELRERWLTLAIENGWSVEDMREEMRLIKAKVTPKAEPPATAASAPAESIAPYTVESFFAFEGSIEQARRWYDELCQSFTPDEIIRLEVKRQEGE